MTAKRLRLPEKAIDALLMPVQPLTPAFQRMEMESALRRILKNAIVN